MRGREMTPGPAAAVRRSLKSTAAIPRGDCPVPRPSGTAVSWVRLPLPPLIANGTTSPLPGDSW